MADPLEVSIYQHLSSTAANLRNDRLEARNALQALVGSEIYLARRSRLPCGQGSMYALTIRRIGRNDYHDNWGDPGCAQAVIEFIALGSADPSEVIRLIDYARICCAAYSGAMGEGGQIIDSIVQREAMPRPQVPRDASDTWGYHHSMDIEFFYKQQSIAFGA